MSKLRSLLWDGLKGAAHPVSLVSLLGPLVLTFNLNWLIRLTSTADGALPRNADLSRILRDPWAFTLADYLIQTYTLVLAVALFLVSFVSGLFSRYRKHKADDFVHGDNFTLGLVIGVVAVLFVGVLALTNGVFGNPDVVALYQPQDSEFWGISRLPPLTSPITWGRGVTTVLGIILAVWLKNRA